MHDIQYIRDNPEAFDEAMRLRNLPPQAESLLALDARRRDIVTKQGELQAERNALAKEIGAKKKAGQDADALMQRSVQVNDEIKAFDDALTEVDNALHHALSTLPNILADDVPHGKDEQSNVLHHSHGEKPVFTFTPKQHFDLGEALGTMDFDTAAKISGARFVILRGQLAQLERALAQFMLDIHAVEFGYEEVAPPALVRSDALFGTGQLPKFAEDLYSTGEHWLIPTSEVPLTNIVADSIVSEADLPMRFTAYTPCFRSEAGSAGRDTRGMIRQHQFSKVELVSIVKPETAEAELMRKLQAAETVLQRLGLHYRVMTLCTGDTGFSAKKTYDIEVWLPGQDAYREISSCSWCGDFQARRMKARYRKEGEKKPQFVHTLNGSGLAIGRTMVALLENYQQDDGSILIPPVLQPYMRGASRITAK
jgi:seryl-tRNA synthetase